LLNLPEYLRDPELPIDNFYSVSALLAMQSTVLAMIDSVCLSDRLSQSGIMSKQL